jgi:hypothetical protein
MFPIPRDVMLNEVKHLLSPTYQKKQKQILRLRLRMTFCRGVWHTPSARFAAV